jgi:hypothetical protein
MNWIIKIPLVVTKDGLMMNLDFVLCIWVRFVEERQKTDEENNKIDAKEPF